MHNFQRKIIKIAGFICLFLILGRTVPRPELYYDLETIDKLSLLIYDSADADSMFDTYVLIAFATTLSLATVFYLILMGLLRRIWEK